MRSIICILLLSFSIFGNLCGQDPGRFDSEIKLFDELKVPAGKEVVVFTGSSSVRLWENLEDDCSDAFVLNTGFGGSHMSDLLYFVERAILRFNPVSVFIYEGDNDISAGKDPEDILDTTKEVVKRILEVIPAAEINFISAKPSPSRWNFKAQYVQFNTKLEAYCASQNQLNYIDVWNPMITAYGRPDPTIFIEDSLHMNRKGYLLWKDIICPERE